MKLICSMLLICPLLLTSAPPALAQQPDAALLKDIHRLLELTGALKMGQQMGSMASAQMLTALSAARGDVPPRLKEIVTQIVDDELKLAFAPGGAMADGMAAIYARYYTPEEIRGLIAFYETPLGRKVIETLPGVAQDSMKLGMEWAQKNFPVVQKRIEEKLKAEGFIKES